MESIAHSITRAASTQTYYTVRYLVDRERVDDAYRAYAYFRWVDDVLDADSGSTTDRLSFLERQKSLLEMCYQGNPPSDVDMQENMLVELVQHDHEKNSGLQLYLRNMMQVMDFDARRRGQLTSQPELNEYTHWLAVAVMECIHYFIGHGEYAPRDETRYMAVSGAHIAHMLRDTFDDAAIGYYNIPQEVLHANHIEVKDVTADAYRTWVKSRVQLAREYFDSGKDYFSRVQSHRCRLACLAYIGRFEWLLDTIENEGYILRPQYNERKSATTALRMGISTFSSWVTQRRVKAIPRSVVTHPTGKL